MLYLTEILSALPMVIMPLIIGWAAIQSLIEIIIGLTKGYKVHVLYWITAIICSLLIILLIVDFIKERDWGASLFLLPSIFSSLEIYDEEALQALAKFPGLHSDMALVLALFFIELLWGWLGIEAIHKIFQSKVMGYRVHPIFWVVLILFIAFILFSIYIMANLVAFGM